MTTKQQQIIYLLEQHNGEYATHYPEIAQILNMRVSTARYCIEQLKKKNLISVECKVVNNTKSIILKIIKKGE